MKACCEAFLNEQFAGDADVVCEIYVEYVSSIQEKLGEMGKALEKGDWEAIDRCAHAVKGNALAVGDQDVADTAIALRGAAKLGDGEKAQPLVERLRTLAAEL
jgi:HPt (histidine-containing phosphotransfer) domain-containing protein